MKGLFNYGLCLLSFGSFAQNNTFPTTGNVGIGTTSPEKKLDVNGDILLKNSTGMKQIFTWTASDTNWRIGMNANPGFTKSMLTQHVQFMTYSGGSTQGFAVGVNGGNSSLEIRGSDHAAFFRGNIGVGTTSPSEKLDVEGQVRWGTSPSGSWGEGLLSMNSGWNSGSYPTLGSVGGSAGSLIMLHNPHIPFRTDNVAPGFTGKAAVRMATDAGGSNWWDMGVGGDFFYVLSKNSGEYLRITNQGNLGIGTTTPDEKLTVKGKIHTEEVRVDLSVPAPDYVFADNYNLPTLESIEKFIKSESHLPEIPSAKEMEANGVELGTMNMLLLKKIEELTLYTLEQQQQIKQLAIESQQQKAKSQQSIEELTLFILEQEKRIQKLEANEK